MPFSPEAFFLVFAEYNDSVWPAQVFLIAAAVVVVALMIWRGGRAARWIWAFLAALWIWTGIAYHVLHFSRINPAALAFGALFVLQGIGFLWWGVLRRSPFEPVPGARGIAAGLIIV